MQKIFSYLMIGLIKGYQYVISPILPKSCRFLPTCSEYGLEALKQHGLIKGTWLTSRRLCRCHPWGASGYDPVPLKEKLQSSGIISGDRDRM